MKHIVIILLFIIGIFIHKKLNRFIKGDHDLLDDRYALFRGVSIAAFIYSVYLGLYYCYIGITTQGEKGFDDLIISFFLLLLFVPVLFLFWRFYNFRYREDRESFTYTSFFRQDTVLFKDIKRVRYYRHKHASGFYVETFAGKRYPIANGYFNMVHLLNYLQLNAVEDIYTKYTWIDLWEKRKEVPAHPAPEVFEMRVKLKSRLQSGFGIIVFPPRSTKVNDGIEQRPSRVSIALLILSCCVFVPFFLLWIKELHRLFTSPQGRIADVLMAMAIIIITGYFAYKNYFSYAKNFYYEDDEQFRASYLNKNLTMQYKDLESLVVQRNKIIIKAPHPGASGLNFIKTSRIKPEKLINYLADFFEVVATDKNGAITIERKVLPELKSSDDLA